MNIKQSKQEVAPWNFSFPLTHLKLLSSTLFHLLGSTFHSIFFVRLCQVTNQKFLLLVFLFIFFNSSHRLQSARNRRKMHTNINSVPSAVNSTGLLFKYEHWFASSYEKNFDYYSKRQWLKDHLYVPYLIAVIYLAGIYLGQRWMKSRQAYQLKQSLVLWNVILAIFSVIGSLRTIPWFVSFVRTHGLHASCCIEPDVSGVYGFWSWAFILSKIPELGDTFFIVARKQKLIFLHWFHHVSVLFFVWYSNSENFSIGSWFITMNYFIHSVMYIHFALRAMKIQISSKVPLLITTLQLLQMAAGTEVTFYAYTQIRRSKMCHTHIRTLYIR